MTAAGQFKHTSAMQTRHMMYVAVPMPAQASTNDNLGYGAIRTVSSGTFAWKDEDHRIIYHISEMR